MTRRGAMPESRRRAGSGPVGPVTLVPRTLQVRRSHAAAWLMLAGCLLVGAAVTAGWRVAQSPMFRVRNVEVIGVSALNATTVANSSGVLGRQLYEVDPGVAAASVEQLPLVKTARVEKVWPNRVVIALQERKPWGTWEIGGVHYLIDGDGTVLDVLDTSSGPIVQELDAAPGLRPGEQVDADAVHLAQALLVDLPSSTLQQLSHFEYSDERGLGLITNTGLEVRLGDSQGLDYKLAVWQALNAKVGAKNIHLLDLRSVDRPYYR